MNVAEALTELRIPFGGNRAESHLDGLRGGKLAIDDYQQYYFSGNQCRLYFSGIYVGEIVYVEYSLGTNKAPIYSYMDQYYKTVAKGNILVQGTFHVNLREKGYLFKVRDEMNALKTRDNEKKDQYLPIRSDPNYSVLQYVDSARGQDRERLFRKYMEVYWGQLDPSIKPMTGRRPDEWDQDKNSKIVDGFDIVMIFGVPIAPNSQYTIKTINDVHIVGEAVSVDDTGRNTVEQYSYFARGMDMTPTIFYPTDDSHLETLSPEKALEPVVPAATSTARDNYPLVLRSHRSMFQPDGLWRAEFVLSTNSDAVVFDGTGMWDPPILKYSTSTTTRNTPNVGILGNNQTIMEVWVSNIHPDVVRVELRDIKFRIHDVGKADLVFTTSFTLAESKPISGDIPDPVN